jgi:putative ABC transport system substrate-binding protein
MTHCWHLRPADRLTDPRQFDILQSIPAERGQDAIGTAQVHRASRQGGCRLAAGGARAQQAAMPVVGFLGTTSPDDFADRVAAFREGLKQVGYVEGQNLVVEYRWPEGNYDRLPTLAADLVRRQVAVIAAVGGEPSPLAAMAATATIPIVISVGTDPVRLGLVTSLNRPSGNITGVYFLQSELGAKRLGLLHEFLPKATVIGMLVNPFCFHA